jgi:hypothetical protein
MVCIAAIAVKARPGKVFRCTVGWARPLKGDDVLGFETKDWKKWHTGFGLEMRRIFY